MNISENSRSSIQTALREALCGFVSGDERSVVTDIHLLPKSDSGELIIFDDDDQELARTIIDEWVNYESDEFYTEVEGGLRSEIETLREGGMLDKVCLLKPYSFVLVDDDKETVSELMLVDDEDTLLLDGELLKGLDQELDDFLKNLLEKE